MPWCSTCDRFLSPSTVRVDGTCPTCSSPVDPEGGRGHRLRALPWYLKLTLAVFAVYLVFRLGQGINWLIDQV